MGKIIIILVCCVLRIQAQEESTSVSSLEKNCLDCHTRQQIPNTLIYRRYLMTYSTKERMRNAMELYMKNPHKKDSIMPPQFFLKFPMKESLEMDEKRLRENIERYIERYDIKKHLILKSH